MAAKLYSMYFILYLFILSSSIFNYEGCIYDLKTTPQTTNNKVCLIIVDGLRYDYVPYMEYISWHIQNDSAVLYKSISGVPSYSRPGYERILTGSETEINGIHSNNNRILSLIPNIFSLCKNKGLKTSCSAFYWFEELYPFLIDYKYLYFYNDSLVFKKAEEFVKKYKPEFIVIHPMEVDNAGHRYGAKSSGYINSVKNVDKNIEKTWDTIKNDGYTLLITSDHGHRDESGHGDGCSECINTPFIIISNNIKNLNLKDNKNIISQIDIAPTICDFLGISKTIYMTGESLFQNKNNISEIRSLFTFYGIKNFKSFFNLTSIITYVIISIYTVIYFSYFIIVIKILNS
ncbi:Sulfatase [Caloramator quimbayensis]|uniref:Sulfatase n=1 Tax=Caloramator quimbayensis TaxID=1147123 RepID=A0A1T4WQM7_9CLOT|nr:alkaline phosphatase family protein [Caloramator quimbayensis]SKA79569.1 Sulfatase [Caloramator quimbayensis]